MDSNKKKEKKKKNTLVISESRSIKLNIQKKKQV